MVDLLEINSKPYGKVKVSQEQLISFTDGVLGFETLNKYYLLDRNEGPFYWLQSIDVTEVAFVIINPQFFKADYRLELTSQDFKDIAKLRNVEKKLVKGQMQLMG